MIKIGVIGIGSIGTAVCNKLLKNGYGLCIYNRTAEKANSFRGFKNVNIAKTPSDVFLSCKTTILALTDDDATRQVVLKNKFINKSSIKEKYIIDFSSISSEMAEQCFYHCAKSMVYYFDAPISGGVEGVTEGSLSIMVGGDELKFEHIKPILEIFGKSVVFLGPSGIGATAKQINQIIVASYLIGIGEAFAFAKAMNINISLLKKAIVDGYSQSRVLDAKFSNIKRDKYPLGGRVSLHLKDLRNAISTANKNNIELVATKFFESQYRNAVDAGLSDVDHSAVHKLFLDKIKNK